MSAATSDESFAAAHRALLADKDTQFALPAVVPPQVPSWLRDLIDALAGSGPVAKTMFWVVVAGLAAALLYAIWRWWRQRERRVAEPQVEVWRPEAAPARALLAEADALAAQGDFAGAAHLVLLRSVEQIAARRPGHIRPALTSRDIAGAPILPGDVARAFALIAEVVETGLFAARPVAEAAWTRCRTAYADVAFPKAWA